MAAQRAVLRVAFISPAREGQDTRGLQGIGSSCRQSHWGVNDLSPKNLFLVLFDSQCPLAHPRGRPSID